MSAKHRYTLRAVAPLALSVLLTVAGCESETPMVVPPVQPAMSIADALVTEGDTGFSEAVFDVTLSHDTSETVTVSYATADVTASAGDDYQAASGVLTVAAGEVSARITVLVNGDDMDEDDETFTVTLQDASNAVLVDATATGTIVDDDDPPVVPPVQPDMSIADALVTEGDTGFSEAVFDVTLSHDTSETVTVSYATADVTASAGDDYQAASGVLTVAAGEVSARITVLVNGDDMDESDETFTVTLQDASNAVLVDATATGTIVDDDDPPVVPPVQPDMSIADALVTEGDTGFSEAVFDVTLSHDTSETVTVSYATADVTASAGDDYQAASGVLTVAAGEVSARITVLVNGDDMDESDETFTVTLQDASNAVLVDATATGTIVDDDDPPVVPPVQPDMSIADALVTEGDTGFSEAVFDVTLSHDTSETVTVSYATADVTASAGDDYQAASGVLTVAAGEVSARITVLVNGDDMDESDETFTVTLQDASNAVLVDATATGTIVDDDDDQPKPGRVFRDCAACPAMVVVPGGSFMMGSPASEAGRHDDERLARMTIEKPFAVGTHEVTFAEWDACVAGGGCGGYRPHDEGWGRGELPVINVSWNDAQAYVTWLSANTGADYRLLSEVEWEYVARAGTTTPFHTGETISTDQANYDGLSVPYGSGQTGVYRARTIAAGSLSRNEFGLYDVHGNVAELVSDCYDTEAAAQGECIGRVVRGGSWGARPEFLRSAYRGWCAPTLRSQLNGFRVARTLTTE